jgi:hypothetical protein
MTEFKLPRIHPLTAVVICLAVGAIWAIGGFSLAAYLGIAEDPPYGMPVAIPVAAKVGFAVFKFPSYYILPWSWMRAHFGGTVALHIEVAGFFANGVFCAMVSLACAYGCRRFACGKPRLTTNSNGR